MSKIIDNKNSIREKYIEIRKNIVNRDKKSKEIMEKLISLEEYKLSKIIAIYNSFGSEVDTKDIINYSLQNGKTVALPRVVGSELKFYKIISLKDDLIKSNFGVEEPIDDNNNLVDANNIDLVIVPGLCFDINKNRLGFGKGYYDRFLSKIKANNIAICFEEQVMNNGYLPVIESDIKVQKIITDKTIYI